MNTHAEINRRARDELSGMIEKHFSGSRDVTALWETARGVRESCTPPYGNDPTCRAIAERVEACEQFWNHSQSAKQSVVELLVRAALFLRTSLCIREKPGRVYRDTSTIPIAIPLMLIYFNVVVFKSIWSFLAGWLIVGACWILFIRRGNRSITGAKRRYLLWYPFEDEAQFKRYREAVWKGARAPFDLTNSPAASRQLPPSDFADSSRLGFFSIAWRLMAAVFVAPYFVSQGLFGLRLRENVYEVTDLDAKDAETARHPSEAFDATIKHTSAAPAREHAPRVLTRATQSRLVAGSVVMVIASLAIIWGVVVMALRSKPIYGLWPVFFGGIAAGLAVVWAYAHWRKRHFYAIYGVEAVAIVIHIEPGSRGSPRRAIINYEFDGRTIRSSCQDYHAFRVGATFDILINPRDPQIWVRRDFVLVDKDGLT